jgi:FKBP-type peptidyl-prolyl cis-trans isomerase (trigger factor)
VKGGVFLSMVFLLVAIPLASSWGQCSEKSLLFLSLLKEGKYQEAHQMQDEKMQKLLPQATLQKMWEDMKKDLGALLSFETRTTTRKDGYLVTAILCRFERSG